MLILLDSQGSGIKPVTVHIDVLYAGIVTNALALRTYHHER
ncbi:hypothetical protein [Nocardioides abyssi]|uniref:Uncharacterized protein n=1 Tax=Nocardioides abyssi TaxID=3058370 RepID=A0ABT8EQI8_9ACTN|nr:hypothetical protein [Nocardioides abyssi]MDN4160422.1 hypothetical protein [Nocardioides abyssi]